MGETIAHQPLTRWERVSVRIYRWSLLMLALVTLGFCIIVVIISSSMSAMKWNPGVLSDADLAPLRNFSLVAGIFGIVFTALIGIIVFNIHLYVALFRFLLRWVYCLGILLVLLSIPFRPLDRNIFAIFYFACFIFCIGFVGFKEYYCFRFRSGAAIPLVMFVTYLMTAYFLAWTYFDHNSPRLVKDWMLLLSYVTASILALILSIQKLRQPLHYDIGNKAAYQYWFRKKGISQGF